METQVSAMSCTTVFSSEEVLLVNADGAIAENCLDSESSLVLPILNSPYLVSTAKIFYDSRTWLGSEFEDDYFSVKGEFTPRCSNAASHQGSFDESPQFKVTSDSKPEPYPSREKKEYILQDPFWIDKNEEKEPVEHLQVPICNHKIDDHNGILPVCKDIKLVEFFQENYWSEEVSFIHTSTPDDPGKLVEFFEDDYWSEEVASIHRSPPAAPRKSKSKPPILHLSPQNRISSMLEKSSMTKKMRDEHANSKLEEIAMVTKYCCISSLSLCRSSKEKRKASY